MAGQNQPRRYREYDRLVKELTPNSNYLQGYARAFWVGGLICAIGQLLAYWGEKGLGLVEDDALMFTSICLIFLGTTLTGLGVYVGAVLAILAIAVGVIYWITGRLGG